MKEYDMSTRVGGTIKERELYDLWVVADCLMSFCEFKDRILAAIQPDPEPQPVSRAALQPDQNISPICQPKPVAESITPVERLFLIKIAMTGTDADFRRYRYRFAKALRATPSSAGTVSVESALPVELTAAQLDDACMSRRHDHGLLGADQREDRRREAADWWRCLRKTIAEPSAALRALAGEGER